MNLYIPVYDKKHSIIINIFKVFLLVAMVFLDILFLIYGFKGLFTSDIKYTVEVLLFLTVSLISLPWLTAYKSGLYIASDVIYYKSVFKKYYPIDKIAGLVILKTQVQSRFSPKVHIKNKNGEYEYSIVYLGSIPEKITNRSTADEVFKGDLDFMTWYKSDVLFRTTYDENAVDYFKSKNVLIFNTKQM